MKATKRFPLRVVLTVTTERLLTKPQGERDNGIGDLYEILNWMTNDNLFTHQLPRANRECQPWLLRWFPELGNVSTKALDAVIDARGADGIEGWLTSLPVSAGVKAGYDVPRIPRDDHVVKNAYDELVEMRGTDEGIVLLDPSELPKP